MPLLAAALVAIVVMVVLAWKLRRERAQALLSAQIAARYRTLVQNSADVILITGADAQVQYASRAAEQMFGYDGDALQGRTLTALVHPDDISRSGRFFNDLAIDDTATVVEEWRILTREGAWLWTENTGKNLLHEATVAGIVVNVRDISERRSLEARLTHQAFHDALTGLANRALFLNRVSHVAARAPRGKHPAAVLFLDLDDFKRVNDSLGHLAGDQLLVSSASRLTACVRPGDTIARLGGDEFAILLEDVDRMDDVTHVADRVLRALRAPFVVSGREVFISVSVGVAAIGSGDAPDEVLRNADLAMYFAKGREKGHYAIYESSMHASLVDRLELEADLRRAVERNEFICHYQPIVALSTGEIRGVEALVRWEHPRYGLVSPGRFIALAEETGLIVPIGRAVLREACRQAREWRNTRRGAHALRMNVNLSGRHFQDASLLEDVRSALRDTGLEPWALSLEITESVLMQRSDVTLEKLRELKALGISLAIDDFGTGYSSLGYLQQFPIDTLKIDRTFIDAAGNEDEDPVLARAIIALGRTLRMETIAEGIERVDQRDAMRSLGCELGQGFLFARPMPAAEMGALLAGDNKAHTAAGILSPDVLSDAEGSDESKTRLLRATRRFYR